MEYSRQTKVVTYQLQGDTTNLEAQLKAAISNLDALDKKLTKISMEARMVGGKDVTNFTRASTVTQAQTQIEKLRDSLTSQRIPSVVSADQTNLIKQMNVELEKQFSVLNKYKNEQNVTQAALENTNKVMRRVNSSFKQSNILLPKVTSNFEKFRISMTKLSSTIALIRMLIRYIGKLYSASADFVEVMNLFNVAAQDSSEKLYSLADNMSEAYNTDIKPILNSIAVFRQYGNTMGFTADQADILSEGLTQLTYDMASLYNVDYESMMTAIKSGLAGQTKALMKYGVSVHQATLEQTALNLGLEKSWGDFTETEKVALRYISILDQASLAQGDLAKTLESPSNQLKIAKAQLQIFIRTLGNFVTMLGQYVLPVFNGLMIAINKFLGAIVSASGYEIEDYSDNLSANAVGYEENADAVEEYEDALKGTLAGIDEINQQNTSQDIAIESGMDPKIIEALKSYDNLMDRINTKTDRLAEIFETLLPTGNGLGKILGAVFSIFNKGIDIVLKSLDTLSPVLNGVMIVVDGILTAAGWLLDNIVSPVLSFIGTLTDNIWLLVAAFTALNLAQLAFTGNISSMMAVKIIKWFATLTAGIWKNVAAFIANTAAAIKTKLASAALAVAIWWETAAWWQKAIAVIAAAGTLALVVGGIVLAATASVKSRADSIMNNNNIPQMATGGVVRQPTIAMIGEGKYNEAVVPLGNSPQFSTMKEDIANEVARKLAQPPSYMSQRSAAGTPIILNLNGKELARAILPDIGYARPQTGVKLV